MTSKKDKDSTSQVSKQYRIKRRVIIITGLKN